MKADDRTRTDNLLITNQLLCQLSHIGLMTPTGIEPVLPPWKGDVLTAWPRSLLFYCLFLCHFSSVNDFLWHKKWRAFLLFTFSSPSRTRTCDTRINSPPIYRLIYRGLYYKCTSFSVHSKLHTVSVFILLIFLCHLLMTLPGFLWSSPRPISISQLHTLPYFHLWPINLVVFKGSY